MTNFIIVLFLILNIVNISYEDDNFDINKYENFDDNYYDYPNYISVVSISYELTYNNFSVIKVTIKSYNEIEKDINFKAQLKSHDEEKSYLLNCTSTFYDTIECFSEKNITLNTEDKFYFYYEKGKQGKFYFNGYDIYEDFKRISLIFKPEINQDQKLYIDKRKFTVHTDKEIINGGYLYIVRQSKGILLKPKDNFNKYIELNNFISHAGLFGYRPQSTLIAFKEAIRRGFHIVDADIIFTKDKIPVICHGQSLEKVSNGKGKISEKTLEELEELDFGSKFDEKYKGEKILTFENLLKLCKENNVIVDLDLAHLNLQKYFIDTDEYLKIMINLIEKYDMSNSIFFNDERQEAIQKLIAIKKDLSFSINGMNQKQNIEKIKDEYKDTKRIIYNMGGLSSGKTINEETVQYGLSLGKRIKASKVDDLKFAEKILSWGVNYITTNNLHPFLAKNYKEEPIIVRCFPLVDDEYNSECEIDEKVKLIDNEIYNIYYSDNIYNISEDINEIPIGEFQYVDTNILNELYYDVISFNYDKGIIHLNTSNKVKKGKEIKGIVGPSYDDVAECYQYHFYCKGNNTYSVKCKIDKEEKDKVKTDLNYSIYSVEGYSLNPKEIDRRLYFAKRLKRFSIYILVIIFLIIGKILVTHIINLRKKENFKQMKIEENSYISDNNLFK